MDENFENLAGNVSQSAIVKEFAGEFESFVFRPLFGPWPMTLMSAKYKENHTKKKATFVFIEKG